MGIEVGEQPFDIRMENVISPNGGLAILWPYNSKKIGGIKYGRFLAVHLTPIFHLILTKIFCFISEWWQPLRDAATYQGDQVSPWGNVSGCPKAIHG